MKPSTEQEYSRRRPRLSDEVCAGLEEYLIRNRLAPEDKLPSERELCALFGVGSRTIREALKALETKGLIRIRHGKGAFVQELGFGSFMKGLANSLRFVTSDEKGMLLELMYVRRIIESGVVKRVAQEGGIPGDLRIRMKENLEAQQRAFDSQDLNAYPALDAQFHEILIAFTGNDILMTIYSNLSYLLRSGMIKTGFVPGSFRRGLSEHQELFEALQAHDPERSVAVLENHIDSSTRLLTELLFNRA